MSLTKYTLPRHTNLAKQSSRTAAFLVDLAFTAAASLALFYGCFNLLVKFNPSYKEKTAQLETYELNSHLLYADEEGHATILTKDNTKEDYASALQYYYFNYLTGEGIDKSVAAPNYNVEIEVEGVKYLPKDYYSIDWYNTNVLQITDEDPDRDQSSCYFTYPKDSEGHYLVHELGVPRAKRYNPDVGAVVTLEDRDIVSAYQVSYVNSYNHLVQQSFYVEILEPIGFVETCSVVCSVVFGSAIIYILLPYILKNGQTPGKKFFKLGLATMDGYKFQNYQLWLRFIPLLVVGGATLLPLWNGVLVLFIIYLVVFLVSFALAMASPKKCAMHDFVARTIVIDYKTSIIFENEIEEEDYINKEDGIVKPDPVESDGEEPELKYEKY